MNTYYVSYYIQYDQGETGFGGLAYRSSKLLCLELVVTIQKHIADTVGLDESQVIIINIIPLEK